MPARRTPALLAGFLASILAWSVGGAWAADEAPDSTTDVTDSQLDRWIQSQNDGYGQDRAVARQDLRLTLALAEAARQQGIARSPQLIVQLQALRGDAALKALVKNLSDKITVPEEALQERYEQMLERRTIPRRVRLYNLFKRYPPSASETDRRSLTQQMEKLRTRAIAGEDFGELAAAHSDSQTRYRKGLIGNVRPGMLAPEIERVAFRLEAGEISSVIHGPDGLTLLFCERVLAPVERTDEQLRHISRSQLYREAEAAGKKALGKGLLAAGNVSFPEAVREWPVTLETSVLRYAGGTVSAEQALVLAGASRNAPGDVSWRTIRATLEQFVRGQMAISQARASGVWQRYGLQEQVYWAELKALAAAMLAREIQERLKPIPDDAVESFYHANRERYRAPPDYQIRLIELPLDRSDPRADYQRASTLSFALSQGTIEFSDVVEKVPAASLIPPQWLTERQLGTRYGVELLRAALALADGQTSDFVESNNQLWIVHRLSHRPRRLRSLDEVSDSIRDRLGQRQAARIQTAVTDRWLQQLDAATPDQLGLDGRLDQ